MRSNIAVILSLALVALAMGCAGSRVSAPATTTTLPHPVHSVALAPSGGLLADAVGVELANSGIKVIDTTETTSLFARLNLNEVEIMQPNSLSALKEQGIDAFLSVRASASADGLPQNASARLTSTTTGQVLAGTSWQNGWGGRSGSIADRMMRKDLTQAAREIAQPLVAALQQQPH